MPIEPRDVEILGRRPHREADGGAPQEQVERRSARPRPPPIEISRLTPMEMLADIDASSVSSAGSGTICGRVEMKSWKASCSSTATAKLVSSIVAPLAPPHRAEGHPLQDAPRSPSRRAMANGAARPKGRPASAREDQRVAGQRHQRAMGEVDQAEDREDDGEAERQQGIGAAEAERVARSAR